MRITKHKNKIISLSRQGKSFREIQQETGMSLGVISKYRKQILEKGVNLTPGFKESRLVKTTSNLPPYLISKNAFMETEAIKEFIAKCDLNRANWGDHLNSLYTICIATGTDPADLTKSLDKTKQIYLDFERKFLSEDSNLTTDRYRKAIRKILKLNNITIPDRDKLISGTNDNAGDYSGVHMTDSEFEIGLRFMKEKGGEQWMNLFAIHHEVFARTDTILTWIPSFQYKYGEVDGKSYEFAECSIYESKQKKSFDKLILDPRVVQISKQISNDRPLISGKLSTTKKKYNKLMRELFAELGRISLKNPDGTDMKYPKNTNAWYHYNRPAYSMRHTSARMWMQRTSFNAGLVSTMGWEDPKTLTKYYAKISPSDLMQQGTCYYCRPPLNKTDSALFCSPLHALAYLNKGVI